MERNTIEGILDSSAGQVNRQLGTESVIPIPVSKIQPNPYQPRKVFKKEALEDLAASIKENGLLEPIIVRKKISEEHGEYFELIAGERRWRASQLAGLSEISSIVREKTDQQSMIDALIENDQREDLCFVEKMLQTVSIVKELGDVEIVSTKLSITKRTIERYVKVASAIESNPDFADIFNAQMATITFDCAVDFASIADKLRALKKSNQTIYYRYKKKIDKVGLKESMPYLLSKFKPAVATAKPEGEGVKPEKSYFSETDKSLSLGVTVLKTGNLSTVERERIMAALDAFSAKLAELNVIDVTNN